MSIADTTGTAVVHRHDVEWEDYCRLRDDPSNDHVRMTYLDGELTMSPLSRHDSKSRLLFLLVTTVGEIDFLIIGTTTLRRQGRARRRGAGKEADEGFYLGADEARVRDNDDLDMAVDPPPSLAIEVDNTVDSKDALPAYARIGVPEVWIYKVKPGTLRFLRLAGAAYEDVDRSLGLPRLTPSLVLEALAARASGGMGDRLWIRWLDGWARGLPEPPEAGR